MSSKRADSVESNEGSPNGIIDIRKGGKVTGYRSNNKRTNATNSVVFDEKQMMSVKVMRSTLEKATSRKNREKT